MMATYSAEALRDPNAWAHLRLEGCTSTEESESESCDDSDSEAELSAAGDEVLD